MNLAALKDCLSRNRLLVLLSVLMVFLLAFNIFGYLYLRNLKKLQEVAKPPVEYPEAWESNEEFQTLVESIQEVRGAKTEERAKEIAAQEFEELTILRTEAGKMGMRVPYGEFSLDPGMALYDELVFLREAIFKQVVNWRSGGFIKARFDTSGMGEEIEEVAKKKAYALLEKYHQRAKKDELMETLIAEANEDPELKEINHNEENETFEYLTIDKEVWHDMKFNEEIFALEEGEVSEIFILSGVWKVEGQKDPFAYFFAKVTEANEGQYRNYQEWFNEVRKNYE